MLKTPRRQILLKIYKERVHTIYGDVFEFTNQWVTFIYSPLS